MNKIQFYLFYSRSHFFLNLSECISINYLSPNKCNVFIFETFHKQHYACKIFLFERKGQHYYYTVYKHTKYGYSFETSNSFKELRVSLIFEIATSLGILAGGNPFSVL